MFMKLQDNLKQVESGTGFFYFECYGKLDELNLTQRNVLAIVVNQCYCIDDFGIESYKGRCRCTHSFIANLLGVKSILTVKKALKQLEKKGYITVDKCVYFDSHIRNVYQLTEKTLSSVNSTLNRKSS